MTFIFVCPIEKWTNYGILLTVRLSVYVLFPMLYDHLSYIEWCLSNLLHVLEPELHLMRLVKDV